MVFPSPGGPASAIGFPGTLSGFYRVSVSCKEENEKFIKALKEIIDYEKS